MKFEIELTEEKIGAALSKILTEDVWQPNPLRRAVEVSVEAEIKKIIETGDFKAFIQETVEKQVRDLASQKIVSLTAHLIRQQVQRMSDSGEIDAMLKKALKE